MARIIHTESSPGWGGQERRILTEAQGMRERGHEVLFCVQEGGQLIERARRAGFKVYVLPFCKKKFMPTLFRLIKILRQERIDIVNTHSSDDAWIAGCAARCVGVPIIRTRHLSSAIRPGLNSLLLYNALADYTVTTCAEIVPIITKQAKLAAHRCMSIPTGIVPFTVTSEDAKAFRQKWGIKDTECVIGTLCVLRGWKGIAYLLHAVALLKKNQNLKWLIVGAGPSEDYFKSIVQQHQIQDRVIFTGHLEAPFDALAAMDIFCLVSMGHEGVSQASLQASWLEKPLVTTPIGGLKEVCVPQQTGILVPIGSPEDIACAVERLAADPVLRQHYGKQAKQHVQRHFLSNRMLDRMEEIYRCCLPKA